MPRRRVISLGNAKHKAPIPAAVVIDKMLFSSAINGKNPDTGETPDDPGEQARQAFENMASLVRSAGGDVDDVAHVTVYLQEPSLKKYIDEQWLKYFPNEDDRPARHAVKLDRAGATLFQLEIIAVLGGAEVSS